MMVRTCVAVAGIVALSWLTDAGAAEREQLYVGAACEVITPDPLLPVSGGLGIPSPVTEKRGELTARAVVFRRGETCVAMVSLDLLGFPSVLCDQVRQHVPRLRPENILIGATHTHSAPDCYAFPDGRGGHTGDLQYMQWVVQRTAQAINVAVDRVQPATLRVATGQAREGIAYNYYAPDLYDRRMSVLQARDGGGRPIVTLVNYAVHPEVLGSNVGVLSPDLVGPLAEQIESRVGGMALFFNGALGGMVTADNRVLDQPTNPVRGYWQDRRTWDECVRIGRAMADDALQMIETAADQDQPALYCASQEISLPVSSDLLWEVIRQSPMKYPHGDDRTVTTRINLVNIGNAQILTIPGEALPNIGFYLKRKMRGEHTLLFGLTNDAFGYIMTKVDFHSFRRYDYISRTSLGEMTGEILLEAWQAMIDQCPPAE